MKKARMIEDNNGVHVSMIDSYLAWTEITGEMSMLDIDPYQDHVCIQCDNRREIFTEKYGLIHCICRVQMEEQALKKINTAYADRHEKKYLNDFQIWGTSASKKQLHELKKSFTAWMEEPNSWMVIHGIPGSGKSHLLMTAAEYFKYWSLYITTSSLESKIFEAMEDDSLPMLIDTIKRVPILLLDDIGSDYGKDFARSVLRKVIDFRYMLAEEYPTVVSTNLGTSQLYVYDPRIADRLHDKQISKVFILNEVKQSWRTKNES